MRFDQGQFEEAEAAFRRWLALRRASLPEYHLAIAESEALLATCLIEREQYAAAEPLLLHCVEVRERAYPPGHQQQGFLFARLQNLYRRWGNEQEADRYLELYRELQAGGGGELGGSRPQGAEFLRVSPGARRGVRAGSAGPDHRHPSDSSLETSELLPCIP